MLVVGARPSGHASGTGPISRTTSAAAASELFWPPVTAMIGAPIRLSAGSSRKISSVSPLFDSASTRSPGTSRPRSPCSASAGCRNSDGVPVDANVALIFCAMNPGFPIPVTTTRPEQARMRSTASEKSPSMRAQSCSMAAASARRTPRAYSAGSAAEAVLRSSTSASRLRGFDAIGERACLTTPVRVRHLCDTA